MRSFASIVAVALGLAAASAASAAVVTITNPGFELDANGAQITAETKLQIAASWSEITPGVWGNVPVIPKVLGWKAETWDGDSTVRIVTSAAWGPDVVTGDPTYAVSMNNNMWSFVRQGSSVNNIVIAPGTYTLSVLGRANWPYNLGANFMVSDGKGGDTVIVVDPATHTMAADATGLPNAQAFSVGSDTFTTQVAATLIVLPTDTALIGKTLGFEFYSGPSRYVEGGDSAQAAIDNASLDFNASVPEPTSMLVLAGAGMLMMARRRSAIN